MAEPATYIDGPRLVDWIERQVGKGQLTDNGVLGSRAKRVRDWRRGTRADVYAVDEVLILLGLHLPDIPDDLFLVYG